MKIVKLLAENVKRLKAVEITPAGNVVTITGKNEQGKTSVLDSIWLAVGGKEAAKGVSQPIRRGEKSAKVTLDLGDLTVTRTWTAKGTYLKVENKEGAEFKSPQELLDRLIGKLAFDPLAFANLDDKKRREILLGLVKLDLDLDAWVEERQKVYDERTGVNRRVGELQAQVNAFPEIPIDIPAEEISATAILEEQEKAQGVNEDNAERRRHMARVEESLATIQEEIEDRDREIVRLTKELQDLNKAQVQAVEDRNRYAEWIQDHKLEVASLIDMDLSVFRARLETVERTNEWVRSKKARGNLEDKLREARKSSVDLTTRLEALDKKRTDALAAAKFPIAGLSFSGDGVTYNETPFSDCSAAERLKVSLAMAMALNPKLRVLRITDGSLLDADNLAIIRAMVEAKDFQLWIERVDEAEGVGIRIEDGMVVGAKGGA